MTSFSGLVNFLEPLTGLRKAIDKNIVKGHDKGSRRTSGGDVQGKVWRKGVELPCLL